MSASSLPLRVVRPLYDRVLRPRLPQKIALWNGVAVRNAALLDATDTKPGYERHLVDGIRRTVQPGDSVLVLGGGYGVSTVHAARQAGSDGKVHTIEASDSQLPIVRETVALNDCPADVTVQHAAVGPVSDESRRTYGAALEADEVAVDDLPEFDVLVMDIEGAEGWVFDRMDEAAARAMVVETHAAEDCPRARIRDDLHRLGYSVELLGSVPDAEGVDVLMGVREDD